MQRHVIFDEGREVSEVVVGRDLTHELSARLEVHRRIALLCQPATERLVEGYTSHLESTGALVTTCSLPDGEAAKNLGTVEDVYRNLNRSGFTRDDVVVGVGGGALTDTAGFIAATYLRGLRAIYVPTTLLGAVDAAIGGKTAVNVDGKNLAGVFSHPNSVLIDVDTLDALPEELKRQGAAEAIKTGFIADMEIVEAYERRPQDIDLEFIVNRSAAVKVAVVNEDFTERARRAILNYGHTVGHAIEVASGITHGEAVAIGMVAAGAASEHVYGFTGADRQRAVLREIGLPTEAPGGATVDEVTALIALDKKRNESGLRFVLLRTFEDPVVVPVEDATVRAAFDGIGLSA